MEKKKRSKPFMDDLKEKRITKQPLEYPSAGSTFKRPEGYFAGKLIQDAGLVDFRSEERRCLKTLWICSE